MSFTSSFGATPSTSPSSSVSSSARSIQSIPSPSGRSAPCDIYPAASTKSSQQPVCAYSSSSWNKSNAGRPSAYISDEDLFGDDFAPFLSEAPLPPRPAQAWILPQPILPPLPPSRRRSSSSKEKKRRTSSSSSKK